MSCLAQCGMGCRRWGPRPPVEQTDFVDLPASLANSSLKSLSGLAAGPNATDD